MRLALPGLALVLVVIAAGCEVGDDDDLSARTTAARQTEEQKLLAQLVKRTSPSGELTHVLPLGSGPITSLTWAPGPSIVFPWKGMFSVRRDGRGLRRLSHFASDDTTWLPSGRELLVGRFVVSADGRRFRRIPGTWGFPAWSPHGDRVAYVHDKNVWVADSDGGNPRFGPPTFFASSWLSGPRWSPDGQRVVYSACTRPAGRYEEVGPEHCDVSTPKLRASIFVAGAERHGPGRFIALGECPDWSARGLLAYDTARGVVISTVDGTRRRLAFRHALQCPAWSPDGRWLAGETRRGLVIADFTTTRLVARLPTFERNSDHFVGSPPAWSPDGKWIAVARQTWRGLDTHASSLYVVRVRDGKTHEVVRTMPDSANSG